LSYAPTFTKEDQIP